MNELSERIRKLIEQIDGCYVDLHCESFDHAAATQLIEQALLAERRLAMEEAAKICDKWHKKPYAGFDGIRHWTASEQISKVLRAAAEREVKSV